MKLRPTTLGKCCEIISGATPKTGEPDFWGGDIVWVTPKDISDQGKKFLSTSRKRITEAGFRDCSTRMLPENSVLLSSRAPIGLVAINRVPVCTNQGFKSLVPDTDQVDSDFLYHWLRAHRSVLENQGNGATFKEISKTSIEKIPIHLPEPSEQKRIAAILDVADGLREKRRQAIAKLDTLLQSVFLDMFGDPETNPRGWKPGTLADVVERLDGGKNFATDNKATSETKYHILKVSAVTWGEYQPTESKPVPVEFEPPNSYFVEPGNLLISRANTRELIGATAYVWETPENIILPDKIWKFVWRADVKSEPLFMHHLLQNPSVRREIGRRASGTSGSMKNIAKPKLLSIPIPLPPHDLQLEFARRVKQIRKICVFSGQASTRVDQLFSSLQQRAFRGEL